jgi:transposase
MKNFLSSEEESELKLRHRKEKDGRTRDRIKAVLMSNTGWSYREISKVLLVDEETVSKHVDEYRSEKKLTIVTGGSESKLSTDQSAELIKHLESRTYLKAVEVCGHVEETYGIKYTVAGMTSWLKSHSFSFIKPRPVPSKANPVEQAAFVEWYKKFKEKTPKDEPILFSDAVHPTMATKITHGWIKKGSGKTIETTASRTRMNIVGAIELAEMKIYKKDYKTVNSESMEAFLKFLSEQYPGKKLHLFLDNGPYNASKDTKAAAEKYNIVLYFIPKYSPNLNPIERLWKINNEYTRNNRYFKTASEFRSCINAFFEKTWPNIAESMRSRITDNFQTFAKSNSSG